MESWDSFLQNIMIEGHGDDLFRFEGRVRINFSSNIPQNVNHEELIRHLCERGSLVGNYPEPEPKSVERRLAQLIGLEPESVIVTNGATEAIYLIAHLFEGKRSAIVAPTFREYQDAAKVFAHRVSFISSIDEIEASDADLVWLCNPNNPTGEVFCRERLLSIIDRCREKVFIIDQAYALYSVKRVLSAEDIAGRDNVVILHSLTKEYMIPGLRIGYAIGSAGLLDALRGLRMPWSVNALAIEAAHFFLDRGSRMSGSRMSGNADDGNAESGNRNDGNREVISAEELHREALRLSCALSALGIEVAPTDCNFILARLQKGMAAELKMWLVENYGILIRDASNFEGLTPAHFRIAAQSPQENDIFIKCMQEWLSL